MRNRSLMTNVFLATLMFSMSSVIGAEPFSPPPPPPGDLLSGPKVAEEPKASEGDRMNKDGQRQDKRRTEIAPLQWFGVVRELDLTPEQKTKVSDVVNAFAADQQAFMAGRSEEERAAVKKFRENRAAGQEPPKEMRQMLQKIESQRPKAEPYQQQVWAMLNSDQQSEFKTKLEQRRQKMMEQQRPGQRGKNGPKSGWNPKENMTANPGEAPPKDPMLNGPPKNPNANAGEGGKRPNKPFRKNRNKMPPPAGEKSPS